MSATCARRCTTGCWRARHGGRFLLRIDDTDAARSEERFVEAIREDLAWLGLEPDGEERQSARLALYEAGVRAAAARRGGSIRLTRPRRSSISSARSQLGRGLPPIYDRAALALSEAERAAKEAEGIAPHWRFKLDHDEPIEWLDGIRGPQHFEPAQLSAIRWCAAPTARGSTCCRARSTTSRWA